MASFTKDDQVAVLFANGREIVLQVREVTVECHEYDYQTIELSGFIVAEHVKAGAPELDHKRTISSQDFVNAAKRVLQDLKNG